MKLHGGSVRMRVVKAGGIFMLVAALSLALAADLRAQATARSSAPRDLTGYWVSVVTEDWRWRMTVPDRSDYVNIPLTAAGRRVADSWDPAKEKPADQCRGYGAPAIMRVPGRLHIYWQDDNTLRIDTDSGTQTRLLHFGSSGPDSKALPAWQGYSVASWGDPDEPIDQRIGGGGPQGQGGPEYEVQVPIGAGGPGTAEGPNGQQTAPAGPRTTLPSTYLKVVTTQLLPGYLRKNGVPYGANTSLEEFFTTFSDPFRNDTWLMVTTVVTDRQYLIESYLTHSHFKKIPDGSGWDPTPCRADEPR
jgi:hypothetical protein